MVNNSECYGHKTDLFCEQMQDRNRIFTAHSHAEPNQVDIIHFVSVIIKIVLPVISLLVVSTLDRINKYVTYNF